jgi:hypothetical protein
MARNDGALARELDFGDEGAGSGQRGASDPARPACLAEARRAKAGGLRLAAPSAVLRGPDKYKVLEHRRRQAQIKARRAIDAADMLDFEG